MSVFQGRKVARRPQNIHAPYQRFSCQKNLVGNFSGSGAFNDKIIPSFYTHKNKVLRKTGISTVPCECTASQYKAVMSGATASPNSSHFLRQCDSRHTPKHKLHITVLSRLQQFSPVFPPRFLLQFETHKDDNSIGFMNFFLTSVAFCCVVFNGITKTESTNPRVF